MIKEKNHDELLQDSIFQISSSDLSKTLNGGGAAMVSITKATKEVEAHEMLQHVQTLLMLLITGTVRTLYCSISDELNCRRNSES